MKLTVAFSVEEREKVEKVAHLVRTLFRIERTHNPKLKKDGYFHFYMKSVKD